jgi:hypothetical protein
MMAGRTMHPGRLYVNVVHRGEIDNDEDIENDTVWTSHERLLQRGSPDLHSFRNEVECGNLQSSGRSGLFHRRNLLDDRHQHSCVQWRKHLGE